MDSEILPLVDFSKVKKKKKVIKQEPKPAPAEDLSNIVLAKKKPTEENKENDKNTVNQITKSDLGEDYTYDFLLERICQMIKTHNPDSSSDRGSIKMPAPVINQVGKTRSAWMNFNDFVTALNRPQEHLFQFVLGELGVEGTIGGEGQALLKSKVSKNQVESILRKYIYDFVQCSNCKSFKTIIKKDQSTRLQQICCESCKAVKTIQHLKSSVKAGRK